MGRIINLRLAWECIKVSLTFLYSEVYIRNLKNSICVKILYILQINIVSNYSILNDKEKLLLLGIPLNN